jgi:hypothetical protein
VVTRCGYEKTITPVREGHPWQITAGRLSMMAPMDWMGSITRGPGLGASRGSQAQARFVSERLAVSAFREQKGPNSLGPSA